jgi:hypothetical protein
LSAAAGVSLSIIHFKRVESDRTLALVCLAINSVAFVLAAAWVCVH